MGAVVGKIDEVVEDIDRRGRGREGEKPKDDQPEGQEVMRGQNWQEQKRVFRPLMRAQRTQHRGKPPRGGREVDDAGNLRIGAGAQARSCMKRETLPRRGPDGQVGHAVADVVETGLAVAIGQEAGLLWPLEVEPVGGAVGLVEQPGRCGDLGHLAVICGRDERGAPALVAGGAEDLEHRLVERQCLGWQHAAIGNLGLQRRAPGRKPARQVPKRQWVAGGQAQDTLFKRVRPAERAVEIDDEDRRAACITGGVAIGRVWHLILVSGHRARS